jgi:hypothetical protein
MLFPTQKILSLLKMLPLTLKLKTGSGWTQLRWMGCLYSRLHLRFGWEVP